MTKPLLTPAEKAFLKAVIKPYRKWVFGIAKRVKLDFHNMYENMYEIIIKLNTTRLVDIILPIDDLSNSYQFKGLEPFTYYDLKTLGL